jgi:hypothetical protein
VLRHRRSDGRWSTRTRLIVPLALLAATVGSCANDSNESTAPANTAARPVETAEGSSTGGSGGSDEGRAIDRDVSIYVTGDDIATTSSQTITAITRAGGVIEASDIALKPEPSASARIEARVPPDRLEAVVNEVAALGELTARQQTAIDVTAQVIDLETRTASARASVERVQALLDSAQNLDDVVLLEGELTKRQTELEQLEAQQQALATQTELTGLVVVLSPPPASSSGAADTGLGEALRDGWDGFVSALHVLLVMLAYLLPFLLTGGLVAVVALLIRRRVRRSRSDAPPSPPTPAPGP